MTEAELKVLKEQADQTDLMKLYEMVSCGNKDAFEFIKSWHNYVHEIDDILDTMEDGRPTMAKEAILKVFYRACELYNSKFYTQWRQSLHPVVVMLHNTYADTVKWEGDPSSTRRNIADVLRCCGNEMLMIVALICGNYDHMRNMSGYFRERSWNNHHDAEGNPI